MIADSAGGAWTFGGSILTFAFPMILFIAVAGTLYVLYTKPELVPGHRVPGVERPVSHTSIPGTPAADTESQTREPGRLSGAIPPEQPEQHEQQEQPEQQEPEAGE